jgi:AcrR family transcriptional regulator
MAKSATQKRAGTDEAGGQTSHNHLEASGSSASDTRQKLIDTAARHFAEFGFEGASLRAIQRELGVNPASVHYHFGSKRAVYDAIMENYFSRIQQERERRFEAIDPEAKGHERLRALIEAYVAPHLEVVAAEHGDSYGRLMARSVVEKNRGGPDLIGALSPLRERFIGEFGRLFTEASRTQIARALSFAIVLMVTIPFERSFLAMTGRASQTSSPESWTNSLVTFSAAGFIASCGELLED